MRLDVVRVNQSMTMRQFYDSYYRGSTPPVSIDQIALINQLEVDGRVDGGTRIKMVR